MKLFKYTTKIINRIKYYDKLINKNKFADNPFAKPKEIIIIWTEK